MIIKEETSIKYEDEDGLSLTDTTGSNGNSMTESTCGVQRADFRVESTEMEFKSSMGGDERVEPPQNIGHPQQYPLQPQTFEDVLSQALPGPSLQAVSCHTFKVCCFHFRNSLTQYW